VKLLDVNLLIYAADEESRHHEAALQWLEGVLSGAETVAFAWHAIVGFLRVTTRPHGARNPWPIESALDVIEGWLAQPVATVVHPTARDGRQPDERRPPGSARDRARRDALLA
jgi:uncharacterized protein